MRGLTALAGVAIVFSTAALVLPLGIAPQVARLLPGAMEALPTGVLTLGLALAASLLIAMLYTALARLTVSRRRI